MFSILFFYHVIACVWMINFHDDQGKMKCLAFSDVMVGILCIAIFGSPYVFIGIILPALESKCFLDNIWTNGILGLFGVIFLVMLLGEWGKISNINVAIDDAPKPYTVKDIILCIWQTSQIFLISVIPLIWSYDVAVKIEGEKNQLLSKVQDEKKMITEDTANDKQTIQGLINALNEKDSEVENYKSQIVRFKEEADQNYKKYT